MIQSLLGRSLPIVKAHFPILSDAKCPIWKCLFDSEFDFCFPICILSYYHEFPSAFFYCHAVVRVECICVLNGNFCVGHRPAFSKPPLFMMFYLRMRYELSIIEHMHERRSTRVVFNCV